MPSGPYRLVAPSTGRMWWQSTPCVMIPSCMQRSHSPLVRRHTISFTCFHRLSFSRCWYRLSRDIMFNLQCSMSYGSTPIGSHPIASTTSLPVTLWPASCAAMLQSSSLNMIGLFALVFSSMVRLRICLALAP